MHKMTPLNPHLRSINSPLSSRLLLTILLYLFLGSLGCEQGVLVISEVRFPQTSSDAQGPYLVLVRTGGVVDEIRAEWSRQAPQDSPEEAQLDPTINQQGMTLATFDGEVWTIRLPGGTPIADYSFHLIASNSINTTRYPAEGTVHFKVRSLNGRCSSDAQCLEGEVCHRVEGYCFSKPESCTRDIHCPRDQYCNTDNGACRFYDSACEQDEQCASGYFCKEGNCVLPCNGRCGGGYMCDGVNCIAPPCASVADCPLELPVCEEGVCTPAPSDCDPACSASEVCVLGNCEPAPCGTGGPCSAGSICIDGQCIGCQADGQCGLGRRCDLQSHRCVEGARARLCAPCHEAIEGVIGCGETLTCVDTYPGCRIRCTGDQDCPNGYCLNNGCISFEGEACEGTLCEYDEDCADSQTCIAGYCQPGQICNIDADCSSDMRCSAQGLCTLRAPCNRGWEGPRCGPGEICVGDRCEAAREPLLSECISCNNDTDCGPQQICGYFYTDYSICASLCDTTCAYDDYCQAISELTSVCSPYVGCGDNSECGWDDYEPNHSSNSAYSLSIYDGYVDAWICSSDEDWYQIDEFMADQSTFSVFTYSPDLYFEFFDFNFFPISQFTSNPYEGANLPAMPGWLRVSSTNIYDENYWMIQADQNTCIPDSFEPNDDSNQAYPLGAGAQIYAELCLGDMDWFDVSPNRRNRIIELLIFRNSFVDRLMYHVLVDQFGNILTEEISSENAVNLSYYQMNNEPVYFGYYCLENCNDVETYELNVEVYRP